MFSRLTLLLALGLGGLLHTTEAKPVVWTLTDPAQVGGRPTEILGTPRVENGALVFDGAHDGVFVPSIPIAGWKEFTIEVLFRPAAEGGAAQRFIHLQDTHNSRALFETRLNGQGGWWLDTFLWTGKPPPDKGLTLIDPQKVHPTDRWYWAAMRYDGKTMSHFVNGQLEVSGEGDFETFADGTISVGVRQNKVYWFKGAIRELRFSPVALPADKLQRVIEDVAAR